MAEHKLIKKVSPQKRQEPGKWHVTPRSKTPLSGKVTTCVATANTTIAPIEMETSLELPTESVPQQLQQGRTVKIPGLGTFRLTFKNGDMEDISSFRANSMIRSVRIILTPSEELRESVLSGLIFKDGGVLEDDVSYASIANYRLVRGVPEGGGDSESPGGI